MLFRPDGSMVTVKSRSKSRDSYHLAALVAHHILIDSDAPNNAGTPQTRAIVGFRWANNLNCRRATGSRLLFLAEFLKCGIGAQRVPERIKP